MKLSEIEELVDWLLYVYSKQKIDLVSISEEKDLPYQKLNRYFNKLTKGNFLNKVRREEIVMGQPKYDYELSDGARKRLLELCFRINQVIVKDLKNKEKDELEESIPCSGIINGFCEHLDDIVIGAKLELEPDLIGELKNTIADYFETNHNIEVKNRK